MRKKRCKTDRRFAFFAFEEHLSAYKGLDAVSIGSRETPEKMAHLLFKLLRQADDDHIPVLFSEVLTTDGIGLAIMNRLRPCRGLYGN